jgi:hypothetical protein
MADSEISVQISAETSELQSGASTASCATTSEDKKTLQVFVGPDQTSWGIPDGQPRQ